ncbi:MAG: N-acetyl-gamma-glutamyl-phosphate reductase [Dehalococcoidia bacterium]|nr:MAG: N-acetyl-gamma-glutamyl-phosphate reductase [Dehalococcoidia bacterium]
MTTTVGILNVTGYAGSELARLLHGHPDVRLAGVTGRSAAGKRLPEIFPHLWAIDLPIEESLGKVDVVFSALPHAAAAEQLVPYIEAGVPVIDLSADFRLKQVGEYEARYKVTHPAPHLLQRAVFGLPELHHEEIAATKLTAVPGCHSTGVILALAPLFARGLIEPQVIADTKTGLSGAGRTLGLAVHFSEADESVAPYGLDGHRHLPEITQELGALAEAPAPSVTFVPHYIPMTRGILSTCYARARAGVQLDRAALRDVYRDFYSGAPFVRVADAAPSTKHVMGTNFCLVHPSIDPLTGAIVVASAIDNLGKGAAGAAVQCLNVMLGLPETAGLQSLALFP